jgi:hypothetical protein
MIEAGPLTKERLAQHYFDHITHSVEQHPITGWFFRSLRELTAPPPDFDYLVAFLRQRRTSYDYNPNEAMAAYSELAVDELFTFDEANALKQYLDRHHGDEDETSIEKAEIPLPNNVGGIGAIAVGGGDDFYELHKERQYSLPFKVEGYFNLVGCELIDEPGETFRHFLFLATVGKHGRVADFRKETQAEARLREAGTDRRERDQAA